MVSRVEEFSTEGKLHVEVGRSLLGILEGEIDALSLLFTGELAADYHREASGTQNSFAESAPFVESFAHANPGLKILEIGAGTGSATRFMLDRVTQQLNDGSYAPRLERYVFTDISPGFFDKAKHTFDQYLDRMEFATLDIERKSLVQGFLENEYDVVVASNVSQYPEHQILGLTNLERRFYMQLQT